MMKKYIRIVAGQYRKTRIEVPEAVGLRPTPDRIRETLFNWLTFFWQSDFSDKRVLDLFAGSGALGFEAASRGVAHIEMVESNPLVVSALRKLSSKLGTKLVRIHAGDARRAISRLGQSQFDLIFLDPPFGQGWFPNLLGEVYPLLTPQGLVYVEAETIIAAPKGYIALRQSRAGAVHYQLFQRVALQES